jgi:hypothetical protein
VDQDLYDIDPEYRKKYDRDMKAYAKEVEAREAKANAEAKKPVQGRLDIDDAERKNREANAKKSIQDLRDLREGKITNDELKERVRARGGAGGGGGGGVPSDKMDKMKKMNYKAGGTVKSSASKRADGCAIRGKTRA